MIQINDYPKSIELKLNNSFEPSLEEVLGWENNTYMYSPMYKARIIQNRIEFQT